MTYLACHPNHLCLPLALRHRFLFVPAIGKNQNITVSVLCMQFFHMVFTYPSLMDNDQHLSVMAGTNEECTMDSGRTREAMPVFSISPVPKEKETDGNRKSVSLVHLGTVNGECSFEICLSVKRYDFCASRLFTRRWRLVVIKQIRYTYMSNRRTIKASSVFFLNSLTSILFPERMPLFIIRSIWHPLL